MLHTLILSGMYLCLLVTGLTDFCAGFSELILDPVMIWYRLVVHQENRADNFLCVLSLNACVFCYITSTTLFQRQILPFLAPIADGMNGEVHPVVRVKQGFSTSNTGPSSTLLCLGTRELFSKTNFHLSLWEGRHRTAACSIVSYDTNT